jgi:DNA-binding winged helix-turn-helix (wHTH) protein
MNATFGGFVVDFDQRRVFEGERELRLTSKAFELLKILLENRPKALSKEELFTRLWPDTFVTENNLATIVADLRGVLGENVRTPRFIRTVYGYGYAFCGEAIHPPGPLMPASGVETGWTLLHEGREIPLFAGANILGRSGPGVVIVNSPTVSRHHARISIADHLATIEDLGSKNGTWVGSTPITGPVAVRDGHNVRLGSALVTVRFTASVLSTETVEFRSVRSQKNLTGC